MNNITFLPSSTVGDVKQRIVQYILKLSHHKDATIEFERREPPEVLEALTASSNEETNRIASIFADTGALPHDADMGHISGVMSRLIHNLEQLEGIDDQRRLLLIYLNENGELVPCKDPISYILLHAPCEKSHPFFLV